ncbi:TetR/AcrR family transcriptional regulator [Paractinoplanes lichenicola]|uniref:TetR/AcrR family transcriptional regulator n=1 Tax=Paractinoplanes lichenicola TaxID=2802976 RepID=A0ABS1VG60_9ACTN|nr:TetR/AcrR family transcriptional regulator [Actinoplanes lichenicola]MBL7252747.1 TetR/AcrR family transcriptional regulator [Actinoplanes lichenicola]
MTGDEQRPAGVRERKRQALRRRLSDTATAMFLADGFDAVRVSDIAEACGVSTKTVWNHFPTKESLILDRGERLATDLARAADGPPEPTGGMHVLDVVVSCIKSELALLDEEPVAAGRDSEVIGSVRAFALLVGANPGLRAATAERQEFLTNSAMRAVAHQARLPVDAPQVHILAGALISLWRLHLSGLLRLGDGIRTTHDIRENVLQDLEVGQALVRSLFRETANAETTAPDSHP